MEKKIYVYENWSSDTPRKLGTLFIDSIRGGEHSSFQFDTAFLADACASQMLFVQSFSFIILLHLLFLIHPVSTVSQDFAVISTYAGRKPLLMALQPPTSLQGISDRASVF